MSLTVPPLSLPTQLPDATPTGASDGCRPAASTWGIAGAPWRIPPATRKVRNDGKGKSPLLPVGCPVSQAALAKKPWAPEALDADLRMARNTDLRFSWRSLGATMR